MYFRPEHVKDTIYEDPSSILSINRDYKRCPMQWDDSINGGILMHSCIIR